LRPILRALAKGGLRVGYAGHPSKHTLLSKDGPPTP
jgi:hypothetical protein